MTIAMQIRSGDAKFGPGPAQFLTRQGFRVFVRLELDSWEAIIRYYPLAAGVRAIFEDAGRA